MNILVVSDLQQVNQKKNEHYLSGLLLQVLDDDVPEERRIYQLILSAVSAGAEISPASRQANLTVTASDFPYGLFCFTQELLHTSEEERIVSIEEASHKKSFHKYQSILLQ